MARIVGMSRAADEEPKIKKGNFPKRKLQFMPFRYFTKLLYYRISVDFEQQQAFCHSSGLLCMRQPPVMIRMNG